jgi:hypothetical protein
VATVITRPLSGSANLGHYKLRWGQNQNTQGPSHTQQLWTMGRIEHRHWPPLVRNNGRNQAACHLSLCGSWKGQDRNMVSKPRDWVTTARTCHPGGLGFSCRTVSCQPMAHDQSESKQQKYWLESILFHGSKCTDTRRDYQLVVTFKVLIAVHTKCLDHTLHPINTETSTLQCKTQTHAHGLLYHA